MPIYEVSIHPSSHQGFNNDGVLSMLEQKYYQYSTWCLYLFVQVWKRQVVIYSTREESKQMDGVVEGNLG